MRNPKLHGRPCDRQATQVEPGANFDRRMARLHLPRQLHLATARGQRDIRLSVAMLHAAVR